MKNLITWFKEDTKDAILSTLLIISSFALDYCLLWLGAIL